MQRLEEIGIDVSHSMFENEKDLMMYVVRDGVFDLADSLLLFTSDQGRACRKGFTGELTMREPVLARV